MATPEAVSAQGTKWEIQPGGTGAFYEIGELRDLKPPALSRKEIETTNHNSLIDNFVAGILRRSPMTATIGYLPGGGIATNHDVIEQSIIQNRLDIHRVTFTDPVPHVVWLFSGYITNLGPSCPVDDGLTADVSVRPTGDFTL
jgi:hypothetical protein